MNEKRAKRCQEAMIKFRQLKNPIFAYTSEESPHIPEDPSMVALPMEYFDEKNTELKFYIDFLETLELPNSDAFDVSTIVFKEKA